MRSDDHNSHPAHTTPSNRFDQDDRKLGEGDGSLKALLEQVVQSGIEISKILSTARILGVVGLTGEQNVFGDEVKRLDEITNDILVENLKESGAVHTIVSEEFKNPLVVDEAGKYNVFIDPLDGSSNSTSNISVGTVFAVYKAGSLVPKGIEQLAAGYFQYSAATELVYTSRNERVSMFALSPTDNAFVTVIDDIGMPETGKIYSVNEAYTPLMRKEYQEYFIGLKKSGGMKLRYVGSMSADFHRTLLEGGIFFVLENEKHPNGKLRLMLEVNPYAMVAYNAGGKGVSSGKNPLEIQPESTDQIVPLAIGSKTLVDDFISST
ncbi:MAG: fructose-1,6-bisphosphatase [Candidatus Dojkabacteria bacterium]